MQALFDSLKSLSDSFNLGRIVLYGASGAVLVLPLLMLMTFLLATGPIEPVLGLQLKTSLTDVFALNQWGLLLSAITVGFLWASFIFITVIGPQERRAQKEIDKLQLDEIPKRLGFVSNLPLFRGYPKNGKYEEWLIQEYFRFLELSAQLPAAIIGAAVLMSIYCASYILTLSMAGMDVDAASNVALGLFAMLAAFGIRPCWTWWTDKVIYKVALSYLYARCRLILALEAARTLSTDEDRKQESFDKILTYAVDALYRYDYSNRSILAMLRDAENRYSPEAKYFRLLLDAKIPFTDPEYKESKGYIVEYDVVADDVSEAVRFVERFEDPKVRGNFIVDEQEMIEARPKDPKGVYRRGIRHYYAAEE